VGGFTGKSWLTFRQALALDGHVRKGEKGTTVVYADPSALWLAPAAGPRVAGEEEYPWPINPPGAKGASEGCIVPVGGVIANAVGSPLASFGVEPRELPLSPPQVWRLIHPE
jgi:antirestriction factor ArdC-like protein